MRQSTFACVLVAAFVIVACVVKAEDLAEDLQNVAPPKRRLQEQRMAMGELKGLRRKDPEERFKKISAADLKRHPEILNKIRNAIANNNAPENLEINEELIQKHPQFRKIYEDYKAGKIDKSHPAYVRMAALIKRAIAHQKEANANGDVAADRKFAFEKFKERRQAGIKNSEAQNALLAKRQKYAQNKNLELKEDE
eukprot:TRINITY_DN1901_c0_g1_i1.p1 TRINITY_DN1901_c0_g1~~TRINITY_DN1901_c0_g1_i1.p1  ORF type:complete len:196 (-),score=61.19 TRINITY_DN1901_c0_g1_i1:187-774(-)